MARSKKEKTGSIYYDKRSKKFRCTYYVVDNESKEEKRVTKSFAEKKEAQAFLTSIQYQKRNHLYIKNNGIPLNQLMREMVERKLDMNIIGERTYARLMRTIKSIEKSPMAKKNIDEIESTEIQEYLNTLKDYSDSVIKKIKEQINQAFKEATNKGYIVRNPMTEVIRPRSTQVRKPVRALEIEEQQKLTNYLMTVPTDLEPYRVAYLIEMYMSPRIGEAFAIRNSDINLAKNTIHIGNTLTTDKDNKIIMKYMPKTYCGIRDIPIPKFIREEIIKQMQLAENHKDKLLFVNSKGEYVRPVVANRRLKEILDKLGIEGISSHSLRHTFATRCIEAGMRPVALQRLMGHSDVGVTLNTYTSVFDKYKEEEISKVNDYYMNNEIIENNNHLLTQNMQFIESKEKEDYEER